MNNPRQQILIVGADSYIGTRFAAYGAERFDITTIDARNRNWDEVNMTAFDTVLYVAGIAHVKQTRQLKPLYYQINRDLSVTVAKKAKTDGVQQFIFMSSMAACTSKKNDYYGDGKRQAEALLSGLQDEHFQVAIVRPPMVYGPGCKGNFPRLVASVRRAPIFPEIKNARSVIFIDNLCVFLCNLAQIGSGGLYHPQNRDYNCTTQMVRLIAACQGKKICTTQLFNWLIYALMPLFSGLEKLFGSHCLPFNGDEDDYSVIDYEESIRVSVCTSLSSE